eukprot:11390421-Alexandrium_andersonii.AAC.1
MERGGLSLHVGQQLGRLVAQSLPQHVLRGSCVGQAPAVAFDHVVSQFWRRLLKEEGQLDPVRYAQLFLPKRLGGYSAGGAELRADAAFYTGSMSAMTEMMRATGSTTVEGVCQRAPSFSGQIVAAAE